MEVFSCSEGKLWFKKILKSCFLSNFVSGSDVESDFALEECARRTSTIKQLERYLLDRGKDSAKCAVIEKGYVDRDFLDDFNSYHSRCYADHPCRCCRVHFFSDSFNDGSSKSPDKVLEEYILDPDGQKRLQRSYLGFMVIRPLRKTVVGRTYLKPYPEDEETGRHYLAVCRKAVSFFGVDLTVDCMPFQEQDGSTAACATCALWSAFSVSAHLFLNKVPSPSAITELAVGNSFSSTRKFPNHGLTVEEMCYAIRKTGLDPVVIRLDEYPRFTERAYVFFGAIYAYLHLGVSVVAVLDVMNKHGDKVGAHAIAINGYHLMNKDQWDGLAYSALKWLSAMRIDKFYANDDQCCPGARFIPKLNAGVDLKIEAPHGSSADSEMYLVYVPKYLIVPLYHKIHVSFEEVAREVHGCVEILEVARKSWTNEENNQEQRDIRLDITLVESNKFKSEIRTDGVVDRSTKIRFVEESLPRFVWCVRVCYGGKEAVVVLIDTTDSAQGLNIVAEIFYDCRGVGEERNVIQKLARLAYGGLIRCKIWKEVSKERTEWSGLRLVRALCGIQNAKKLFENVIGEADGGDVESQLAVGIMYEFGEGVEVNRDKAFAYYAKAWGNGNVHAGLSLARICEQKGESNEAVGYLEELVRKYDAESVSNNEKTLRAAAYFNYARLQQDLNLCDLQKVATYYERAAELDHTEAQYKLAGVCDKLGKGKEACGWYESAASKGHMESQHMRGFMHKENKEHKKAIEYFQLAARQGHRKSQYELAGYYCSGTGLAKDMGSAVRWYRAAAEQGHVRAQFELAKIYENEGGAMYDVDKAIAWYVAVSEQSEDSKLRCDALLALGRIFKCGKNGTIDKASAREWFKKADQFGCEEAKKELEDL